MLSSVIRHYGPWSCWWYHKCDAQEIAFKLIPSALSNRAYRVPEPLLIEVFPFLYRVGPIMVTSKQGALGRPVIVRVRYNPGLREQPNNRLLCGTKIACYVTAGAVLPPGVCPPSHRA